MKKVFSIVFLGVSFFFSIKGFTQTITLEEVRGNLLANPPDFGDSAIRRNCFKVLDVELMSPIAQSSTDIAVFYNAMISNVVNDINSHSSGLCVIYKMYNMGFIIKTEDMIIGIDLVNRLSIWDPLPKELLEKIDVIMVTHEHADHYNVNIINSVIAYGGIAILPTEMTHTGSIKMSPGDSIIIKGVKFKAHDGLHSVPLRVYEIITPMGLKVFHTGDNQSQFSLPYIKGVDVLLLDCWVHEDSNHPSNVIGMYDCINLIKPKLMIPGHFNEIKHDPSQRYQYDSVFKLMQMEIPCEVKLLAWGEKTVFKPNSLLPIYKTATIPDIDGLWDSAWAFVPEISMQQEILETPENWFDFHGSYRAMWDEYNLYFFVSVYDDTLRTDNADPSNNDAIELYFDGDNSKNDETTGYDTNDNQMRFVYMGDEWHAPNSEYAFHKTNLGYNFELKIPVNDLIFKPSVNKLIGFDIQVNDNDEGIQNTVYRWWCDDLESMQNPGLWGTAKLVESTLSEILNVEYTPTPFEIDAIMDNSWTGEKLHAMNHVILGEENETSTLDANVQWNAMWDTNFLYFWFEIKDDSLINDSGNDFFQDDCVEFWIDGDNNKDTYHDGVNDFGFQFRYHPDSIIEPVKVSIGPAIETSKIFQAAKLNGEGYILEVAYPLELLGIKPYDSSFFGFDLDYNDDDNGGDRDTKYKTYATFDNAWQFPNTWGTAMLVGSGRTEPTQVQTAKSIIKKELIFVYPNPTDGIVFIQLDKTYSRITLKIKSISGQTLSTKRYDQVNNLNISLADKTGLYLLELISSEGKKAIIKILKK